MPAITDSFFKIFQPEVRTILRRFFESRQESIPADVASTFADDATLTRMGALGLLEYDGGTNDWRLDDRVERFLEEMLGAAEIAQAEWLSGLMEELQRLIDGYRQLADSSKGEPLIKRIVRMLRTCDSRCRRHLEEITSAVDIDYRAGADYEVKSLKLHWHLDRARSFGNGIADLDNLLRNDPFFHNQRGLDLMAVRGRLIRQCACAGDALVGIYQCIEEYINRVLQDHVRARKLIQLRGLLNRQEHIAGSNLEELAVSADGPWFGGFRFRAMVSPTILDDYPAILPRVLRRMGMIEQTARPRRVEIQEYPPEDLPPVIDWQDVFQAFGRQHDDLFAFLAKVQVDGRSLTEEERILGYCSILANEDFVPRWDGSPFPIAASPDWEYAVVNPPHPANV